MNFNREIFELVLKQAELSTIDFEKPIEYDDEIIEFGEKYLETLFDEPEIVMHCEGIADDYYYMLAAHALYAAFCIANGEKKGESRNELFGAVSAVDSVMIMRLCHPELNTDNVDWYISTLYDMATNSFKVRYNQKVVIDNNNEYIQGLLMGFFVIGYNLTLDYFEEEW